MMPVSAADFKRAIVAFDGGKTEKEIDRHVFVIVYEPCSQLVMASGTWGEDLRWRAKLSTLICRRDKQHDQTNNMIS
jgi:hypothetical protein